MFTDRSRLRGPGRDPRSSGRQVPRRPAWWSAKACSSPARSFITDKPWRATGSPREVGHGGRRRKRERERERKREGEKERGRERERERGSDGPRRSGSATIDEGDQTTSSRQLRVTTCRSLSWGRDPGASVSTLGTGGHDP
ncbi:MAG TPA: hypothetical protein ENK18_20930 [Deltaproteobacteria bacterium]|nr:hypothetical protein [Deltaproteobacteria bacterium]